MAELSFLQRRRLRKNGREWLRHLRHYRRMREDVADAKDIDATREAEAALAESMRNDDLNRIPPLNARRRGPL